VDLVIELGRRTIPVEIKLSRTVRSDAFRGLDHYAGLAGVRGGVLVNGGDDIHRYGPHVVRSWRRCS
jgi:hypothetical protein